MKKKLFSILLTLAMVLTMMPAMASVSFAGEANTTVPVELVKATTSGSRAIKLSWNKVSGATKYVVYGQKCGKKYKKLTTTTKTSYKVKKIKKTKLKAHKTYKFYVVAYKGSKKLVTSKSIHFITGKTMGKYANAKSIKVSPTSVTLEPGKTAKLKTTTKIYKNKKHIKTSHGAATRYVSNNPTVATVNSKGVVTAKKEGTATIYVQDIGGLWCKTVVTVKAAEPPAPTEYTVSFDMQGHGTQIGSITDVQSGTKITKPADPTAVGYTFKGWFKEAACTHEWNFNSDTVTANTTLYAKWSQNPVPPTPVVHVTSVSLDMAELSITVGDPDIKLTATVLPDNATNKAVTWTSSNTDVATVDENGNVHAVAAGTAIITVTTVDGSKTATCEVTVIEATTHTVTFNPDNGTDPRTVEVTYGMKVNEPGENPTFANHTFAGWYKIKDPTTGKLSDPWDFDTDTVTADVTLYAKWTITLEKLLPDDFPGSYESGWVKNNSSSVKMYFVLGLGLFSAKANDDYKLLVNLIDSVNAEKVSGGYQYINGGSTVIFSCDSTGVLTSIKYSNPNDVQYSGTYAPALTSIEKPTAVSGLIYNGSEQTGVAEDTGYTVENGKKTNAGEYTATVKLEAGYKWSDDTTSDLEINWSIAKATYDMSGVTFEDKTVDYNGQEQEIKISGELPEGVEVSYSENNGKDARVYGATAKFTGDEENYEPIEDMSATLTIQKASLTATADDKNVTVGSDAPEYTITYTGWVEGESIETVTPKMQPELVCNYTKDSPAGEYAITFTTWPDFENYDASAVNGKLTAAAPATTYTVTFDMNGIDDPAPNPQTITSGEKVSEPDEPADDNHTFDGWYKTKDVTTGILSDKWDFDNGTVSENMTLYAQWTRTLVSIIGTNTNFPSNESSDAWIPDNPWVKKGETGFVAFFDEDFNELIATTADNEDRSDGPVMNLYGNNLLTKVNDNYVYAFEDGAKVICYMEGETFTSFEFEDTSDEWGILSGTYAPAASGNPNVFDYAGAETTLDFSNGRYGERNLASGNPIVINGITGNLSITGDTTGREVHAFVQNGGKVSSANSDGTIKAYLGGSEDAQGIITAGTEDVAGISLGTDFAGVNDIIANTTGKISIGVSDYTKKIDLELVNAEIEITTPLAPVFQSGLLELGHANGLIKNIDENDTLTFTAAADVKKVLGTNGNDIISMDNSATVLTEIDLASGGGHDTVIVNENLWKYDGSNLGKYTIDVKSNDQVKIGNVASCGYKQLAESYNHADAIKNVISSEDEYDLYFIKIGYDYRYLVYDKDKNKNLSADDIVIQIFGANSVSSVSGGYITFSGD